MEKKRNAEGGFIYEKAVSILSVFPQGFPVVTDYHKEEGFIVKG